MRERGTEGEKGRGGGKRDVLLRRILLDDGRLERLLLRDERRECEILFRLESEDGRTRSIGLFVFRVCGHSCVRKLDFDDQLVAMFFEMEHGKVDNVDFFGALQQEFVMGGRNIVSLAANLEESQPPTCSDR